MHPEVWLGFAFRIFWLVNLMKTVEKVKKVKNEEIISGKDNNNFIRN